MIKIIAIIIALIILNFCIWAFIGKTKKILIKVKIFKIIEFKIKVQK